MNPTYTLGLLTVGAVGCWWFVIVYSLTNPWWRNALGSALVLFPACLGLLMTYFVLVRTWPAMPWRSQILYVLWHLLTAIIAWRCWVITTLVIQLRRQRRERHGDHQ